MSSAVNPSKIPKKLKEDYTKPDFYRKTRHLSNVDSNARLDIRTSRSSITGDDELKQKPRKNSFVAEGKKTAGRKNSERCGGKTIINDDKENIAVKEDGMEMSRPLTAAEVIKGVIDEVFPDGQDEDSNVIEAAEEETFKLPEGVVNIDIEDGLYEYAAEVIVYLKEREKVHVLPDNFLKGGSTHANARAMLVDWLIQVQHHLQLCQETLYLTIIMLDTVLAQRDIKNEKLQLVGVTCMLLASKLEEYYPADISKLVHLTNDSYTNTQIVRMELIIIDVLEYKLYFPEIMSFLRRFARAALRGADKTFEKSCQYLIDSAIVEVSFSSTLPSVQAAAGVLAANLLFYLMINKDFPEDSLVWTSTLEHYTNYNICDLAPSAETMIRCIKESKYKGASNKYKSNSRHQRIAMAAQFSDCHLDRGLEWLER